MLFRISLLIGISALLHGTTAKPYPRVCTTQSFQFDEFKGKLSLEMKEVEPWEDLTLTKNKIDPEMAVQKQRMYIMAEEDRDDLYHPSLELKGQIDDHVARGGASDNIALLRPGESPGLYSHPEEDRDHLYHGKLPAFQPEPQVPVMQEKLRSMVYLYPEEDRDHMYHR
ncbi:hypothetical protein GN956_G11363 [Arapaima gigas]